MSSSVNNKKSKDPISLLKDITLTDESRLKVLINDITSKGENHLDIEYLKAIKCICRKSDENVLYAYDFIWNQLKKNHSQIRYSCVQLIDYLFQRAVVFRKKIIENLPEMLDLTICSDNLPLPANWASKLKILTYRTMTEWNNKFGYKNKQIKIGFNYMKNNQQAAIDQELEHQRKNEEKFQRALESVEQEREIVEEIINVTDSCFHILIPEVPLSIPINQKKQSEELQKENKKVTYPIVITPDQDELLKDLNIKETSDNTIIFQKLREYYNQIKTEKLRAVGNLILKINGIDTDDDNKKKETVNMLNIWKQKLKDIKEKCEKINVMELRTILEGNSQNQKMKNSININNNDFGYNNKIKQSLLIINL